MSFTKAKRTDAYLRLGLIGPAGSGKTATALILAAADNERAGLERFRTAVFVFIQDTVADINSIRDKFTEAKRIKLRQDASFTILNLAQALKNLGLTGIAKELRDRMEGQKPGEDWQRANVLVQVNTLAGGGSSGVAVAARAGTGCPSSLLSRMDFTEP